jgi:hypothetical protein
MRAWLVLLLLGASLPGQQQSKLLLPDETAGFNRIVQNLVSAFDHVDIVALGDSHWRKVDSDLRIALVRNPEFAKKVRFIVVEFGSTAQQPTLDRYTLWFSQRSDRPAFKKAPKAKGKAESAGRLGFD